MVALFHELMTTSFKPARDKAMDYLANRAHSQLELERKLLSKGYEGTEIDAALAGLKQDGLLNDALFAESFIYSRINKGQGPLKIRMELKQRGVDDNIIDAQLAADKQTWIKQAELARAKRFGESRPKEYKEQMRQARFLQQRGFNAEHIRFVLNNDELN